MNRARLRVVPIKVVSLGSENNDQHKRFPEIKTCQRLIYFRTVLTHLSLSFLMIAISVSLHQPSAWPSKIYMISFKARKRQSLVIFGKNSKHNHVQFTHGKQKNANILLNFPIVYSKPIRSLRKFKMTLSRMEERLIQETPGRNSFYPRSFWNVSVKQ